jgi:hypothetical protein
MGVSTLRTIVHPPTPLTILQPAVASIVLDGQRIPVTDVNIGVEEVNVWARDVSPGEFVTPSMISRGQRSFLVARTVRPAHHRDLMLVASDRLEELGDAAMAKALREAAKE